MKKEDKKHVVEALVSDLQQAKVIYLLNTSSLDAVSDNHFRRMCFGQNMSVQVVKNSLLRKAMEQLSNPTLAELYPAMIGQTAVVIAEVANAPAKLVQKFGQETGKMPIFKAAFLEEMTFVGEDKLKVLASLKSKDELLADVMALLQSPMNSLLSALENKEEKHAVEA